MARCSLLVLATLVLTAGGSTDEQPASGPVAANVDAGWSGPVDALVRSFDEERRHGHAPGRGAVPAFSSS